MTEWASCSCSSHCSSEDFASRCGHPRPAWRPPRHQPLLRQSTAVTPRIRAPSAMCHALFQDRQRNRVEREDGVKDFGLPAAIRTDNGVPFGSPYALYRLSKLSVWWLPLGIQDRAHHPRSPGAERPPRAMQLAPHHQRPPTSCSSRRASIPCRALQPRAAAPGVGHESPGRRLHALSAGLSRPGGALLSDSRPRGDGDQLRPHLLPRPQDQISLMCLPGRSSAWRRCLRRPDLARHLDDYDLGYFDDETCRPEPIDNPSGAKMCYLCPEHPSRLPGSSAGDAGHA
jgi:putative transposase